MNSENRYGWVWLQALGLSDEAERLQRQFLRYVGPSAGSVNWEPPADIHETEDGLVLLFALPGVAPEDIDVHLEQGELTVSAVRRLKSPRRNAVIRRLEIPHGRFIRRIALAGPPLEITSSRYQDGCLEVNLVRAQRR
jgi:HSP20 family protein